MEPTALSVFFPPFCVFCGYLGTYICKDCMQKERITSSRCHYCRAPTLYGFTHPACSKDEGLDGVFSFFSYRTKLVDILHRAKYNAEWRLYHALFFVIAEERFTLLRQWKRLYNPVLCPVPLHSTKELRRGFNQAEIISELVGKKINLPTAKLVVRIKNTQPQASMDTRAQRHKNIRGAFTATNTSPPCVVLVDDIETSGATLRECAKTLKKGGVKTVLAVSVAKG